VRSITTEYGHARVGPIRACRCGYTRIGA